MTVQISISIDPQVLKEFDAARGIVKRSTLIGVLMRREIDAVGVQDRQVPENHYGSAQINNQPERNGSVCNG